MIAHFTEYTEAHILHPPRQISSESLITIPRTLIKIQMKTSTTNTEKGTMHQFHLTTTPGIIVLRNVFPTRSTITIIQAVIMRCHTRSMVNIITIMSEVINFQHQTDYLAS